MGFFSVGLVFGLLWNKTKSQRELFLQTWRHRIFWLFQKYSNWDEGQGGFVFLNKETLMKYKVIVTTMVTAGR